MNRYYAATIPGIFALFAVWFGNGIWHGAEWKYIIYGLYYYVIMVLGMLLEPVFAAFCRKCNIDRNASWYHIMQTARTFILVNIGMLIFRAKLKRCYRYALFCISSMEQQSLFLADSF